jgi:hypothetical protein
LADFIRVPATTIGSDGLPDIGALQLQTENLDKVETFSSWVSDSRPSPAGGSLLLPYLLLVFASGRELTLPLPRQRDYKAATVTIDAFRSTVTAADDHD